MVCSPPEVRQLQAFFVGDPEPYAVGAFGSSITEPATSYAHLVKNWIITTRPEKLVSWTPQAISGHWPWSNLIRYPAQLRASMPVNVVLCDYRLVNDRDYPALEALTRRIYTDNPQAVIISPIFPEDTGENGAVDALTQLNIDSAALGEHYGVHFVDYRQEIIDRVAGGDSLSLYMADAIHPTSLGQQICEAMIEAEILANNWLIPEDHSILPARLYDDGSYEENEPSRQVGTAGTRTGTWTVTGTRIESSTAGSTVEFTATCQSFGLYRSDSGYTIAIVDVQVDGGAWQEAQAISHNGFYGTNPAYGLHTIKIRIRAATSIRIDEFWAI